MGYLLDTNVVSETSRPRPDPSVADFLASRDDHWISVVTLFELRSGIVRLPASRRRNDLELWLDRVKLGTQDRFLQLTAEAAELAAQFQFASLAAGRDGDALDAMIAATAALRGLTVATRNIADFAPYGVPLLDPWRPS